METLRIELFEARYRMPSSALAERGRLDRVLRDALPEALERAMERAAVPAHEEICIRAIRAPVTRFRSGASEVDLAVTWGLALAEAIREAIARAPSADVVRYGSRGHALLDMVTGIALGDHRRSWAWRMLGLWHAETPGGDEGAMDEVVRALLVEPTSIVPVVAALASGEAAGEGTFAKIAPRIGTKRWVTLAEAALGVAGGAPALGGLGTMSTAPAQDEQGKRAFVTPRWVLDTSHIARATVRAGGALAHLGRPLALLSLLEVEPAMGGRRPLREHLLGALEQAITEASGVRQPASPPSASRAGREGTSTSASAPRPNARERDAQRAATAERPAEASDAWANIPAAEEAMAGSGRGTEHPRAAGPERAGTLRAEHGDVDGAGGAGREQDRSLGETTKATGSSSSARTSLARPESPPAPSAPEEDVDERPLPDVRRSGTTRAGGLLFLLHLVGELDIPRSALADDVLGHRPLGWTLHRIALDLASLDESDPAALAFAGLRPGDAAPSKSQEDPADEEESSRIAALSERIRERLHERLGRPSGSTRALCDRVTRRRADIVADPGWFDVHLRLDEVSVEVRRAGLDLDPNYVPWIGAVVKFRYA